VVATIRELVKVNPLFKEHFNFYTQKIDVQDPFKASPSAGSPPPGSD
jgi:ATP-dependent Lon protease